MTIMEKRPSWVIIGGVLLIGLIASVGVNGYTNQTQQTTNESTSFTKIQPLTKDKLDLFLKTHSSLEYIEEGDSALFIYKVENPTDKDINFDSMPNGSYYNWELRNSKGELYAQSKFNTKKTSGIRLKIRGHETLSIVISSSEIKESLPKDDYTLYTWLTPYGVDQSQSQNKLCQATISFSTNEKQNSLDLESNLVEGQIVSYIEAEHLLKVHDRHTNRTINLTVPDSKTVIDKIETYKNQTDLVVTYINEKGKNTLSNIEKGILEEKKE